MLQEVGIACAKSLRSECVWHEQARIRSPLFIQQSERGRMINDEVRSNQRLDAMDLQLLVRTSAFIFDEAGM